MMERWTSWCNDPKRQDPNGKWVLYVDAQRAVAEAERRGRETPTPADRITAMQNAETAAMSSRDWDDYERSQQDAVARIRAAVEALPGMSEDERGIWENNILAAIDAGGDVKPTHPAADGTATFPEPQPAPVIDAGGES